MSSRIEQLIDEIEAYIDNCKYKAFSTDGIRESSAIEKLFWMMPSKRQRN